MAAKSLGNLPMDYPNPINNEPVITMIDARKEGIPTAQEIIDEFPSVFDGQVRSRVMDGEQFCIALAKNVIRTLLCKDEVAFAYRDKLKAELELLQQHHGIITPVTEATHWRDNTQKGTYQIRMCVEREQYQSPTPAEAVADIRKTANEAKYFKVIDAIKGYHQCPLAKDSQHLLHCLDNLNYLLANNYSNGKKHLQVA